MARHSANYQKLCNITLKRIKTLYDENPNFYQLADRLSKPHIKIWPNDIRRAIVEDYVSPALVEAVIKKRQRTRICADVTKAQRQALKELAAREGLTWSEYCRRIADNCLNYEGAFEIHSLDLK